MYTYNIYINYNEKNNECLKKYQINEEHEIFQEIWRVQFPYLFKKGDIIRIDNMINEIAGAHYLVGEIKGKVETLEFDLHLIFNEPSIDINIGLDII